MTSRELTNFMAEANIKKEILNDREINLKDVSIFNIIFIYPAAILSLAVIFATIFKYLPILQRFFDFSIIY